MGFWEMLFWAASRNGKSLEPYLSKHSKGLLPGDWGDGGYLGVEDIAGNSAEH